MSADLLPQTLVVDASVGIKWVIDEIGSDQAAAPIESLGLDADLAAALATNCAVVTADKRFATIVASYPYLTGKVLLLAA